MWLSWIFILNFAPLFRLEKSTPEQTYLMTQLFFHIEYLLLRHDCVIVPGWGAFIAEDMPAHFNREQGVIEPPFRRIMFNRSVTADDGLLANSFVRKSGATFEEARLAIAREVALISNELHQNRQIKCGNLGTLSLNEEDRFVFTPKFAEREFSTLLGYAPAVVTQQYQAEASDLSSEYQEQEFAEDAEYESSSSSFKFDKTLIRVAAVFIALIAVAIAVVLFPIPHDSREQRASVVPVAAFIPEKQAPSIAVADTVTAVHVKDSVASVAPAQSSHYLIVATFSSEKEAQHFIANNKSDFTFTAVPSKKLCRVAVAESDNQEELREILNTRKILASFPDAWIWSRN